YALRRESYTPVGIRQERRDCLRRVCIDPVWSSTGIEAAHLDRDVWQVGTRAKIEGSCSDPSDAAIRICLIRMIGREVAPRGLPVCAALRSHAKSAKRRLGLRFPRDSR